MTTRASGPFEVKLTPQPQDGPSAGPTVGRLSLDKQFHGDLEATSKGEMLAVSTSVQGSAGYVAMEQVRGTLQGKSGTFALQHNGTMTRGTPQLTITVVPDSGTDQLVGLAGRMAIEIADGKHSYDFEYTLADSSQNTNPNSSQETTMPGTSPSVIPMLSYEDGFAALEWLSRAFGFRERTRMAGAGGRLAHGEMEAGDGVIMLATPTSDYEGPKKHREVCERTRRWLRVPWVIDGVLVVVADVDEHYARAKREGATILSEPEDGPPGRRYRVEDLEGHRWMFMERESS